MMRKIRFTIILTLTMCIFILASCSKTNTSNNETSDKDESKQSDNVEATDENTSNLDDTGENKEEDESQGLPDIENFAIFDSYIKDYRFDTASDIGADESEHMEVFSGLYDLDGDGDEDSIEIALKTNSSDGTDTGQSYIEVNDKKELIDIHAPAGKVHIIDLDTRDDYSEIAIHDHGASADDILLFYRYDGKDLFLLGQMDRYGLMDGKGRFISWFNWANNFKPQFYSAWEEIKDSGLVSHNHDIGDYIGKDYHVSGDGYFLPLDKNPGDDFLSLAIFDIEYSKEFKDSKVKVIDILGVNNEARLLNWFYVEMEDGQKGLMYFWIGD